MTIREQQGAGADAAVDELGPINVVVLAYPPGAPMTGEAAPILMDLAERGIVRIFDVMIVMKGEDGSVVGFEAKDLGGKDVGEFHVFEGASSGLLGDADAQQAAEALEPGWSAAVILYENRWAAPFIAAVRRNGGEVLDAHRISPAELMEVLEASEG